MECVKKTWLGLMCSANDLMKNGISFFQDMENGAPDERSFGNENEKIVALHAQIRKVKNQLHDLDEELWRYIISGLPNKAIQNRIPKASISSIPIFDSIPQNLKRRYEGLPYPVNAIVYCDEDVVREKDIFLSRFPVKGNEDPPLQFATTSQSQGNESHKLEKSTPTTIIDNSCERRPSRLSSGPPRKPRGSRPHPFLIADEIQRNILNKPSLLAQPRKRKLMDKNSVDEVPKIMAEKLNAEGETRKIKKSSGTNSPKKAKIEKPINKTPKKSAEASGSAKSKKCETPPKKNNGKKREDASNKATDKTKKILVKGDTNKRTNATKEKKLITSHFVAKKSYAKVHNRSSKKL